MQSTGTFDNRLRNHGLGAAFAIALGLGLAAPATARAQIDPYRPWLYSSAIGVADGQYARISAYFEKAASGDLPPGPCRVTLRFVDGRGAILAESATRIGAARAISLDYRPVGLRAGERATVRAVLRAEPDDNGVPPLVIPTLEVADSASGRTTLLSPGSIRGFNPQPEPPGDFGITYLASMQVARVSASYVDLPSERGLPPGPCRAVISFKGNGGEVLGRKEVTLAPGETIALDFAAGYMVGGVRRRLWATVTTDGNQQGFVTKSLEIFDQASGQSTALHPSQFVQSWGWE